MEYDLKCVAKIHDIGFRVDAKLEIRGSYGSGYRIVLLSQRQVP